jgi:hypothetical protein
MGANGVQAHAFGSGASSAGIKITKVDRDIMGNKCTLGMRQVNVHKKVVCVFIIHSKSSVEMKND